MSETTAKAIRVITLPPIIALFLIILLKGYFPDGHDLMAIVLLCGLPLLSYLYWKTIPGQYEQGRTSQRKLAIPVYFQGRAYPAHPCGGGADRAGHHGRV
ncbi:unknown [Eggerthella sp. CAG:1427]|nr:unknown [Eggerthella sp. CAG:1427]